MYSNEKINDDTYLILDDNNEAMYLIVGSEKALLIDTGFDAESLYDYVSKLTDKEIDVVLTHGHIDHIAQSYEFENVYLAPADLPVYITSTSKIELGSPYHTKAPSDLLDLPAYFDLGNKDILTLPLIGHTPGSHILIDAANKCIYTGDAIGSGCGVWMQLDDALDILTYKNSLSYTIDALKRIGVDDSWSFYGGHYGQHLQSKVSDHNPLNLTLMENMCGLCDQILLNLVEYEETEILKGKHTPYYVSYHTAEMFLTKDKVNKLN